MKMQVEPPTIEEVERTTAFCHTFARFLIAENVKPEDAMLLVAGCVAQLIRNISDATRLEREDVAAMFSHNVIFFMNRMTTKNTTAYPYPRERPLK